MELQVNIQPRTENNMTTEKKVARRKLSLLELASDLGNVSPLPSLYSLSIYIPSGRARSGLLFPTSEAIVRSPEAYGVVVDASGKAVEEKAAAGVSALGLTELCSHDETVAKTARPGSNPRRAALKRLEILGTQASVNL